jgi:transcriptional regulator with XRE-family HTH domain
MSYFVSAVPSQPSSISISSSADLGTLIRRRRKSLSISQADLASLSGVAQPNLSKIERGQTPATLETYLRILGALGIDLHGVVRQ